MFYSKKNICLGLSLLLLLLHCADTNDLYYSNGQANGRIFLAFKIKDTECNYTHRLTAVIPYESRKREVDACVQAILTKLCGDWNVSDPTPLLCKTINYRINYKIGGTKK
ncbi:MAG: hypothetical protein KBF99_00845 [Leptospiraceae bacterium]|nr:hypothetical protein [Leptospiraceae bacterium]MBK7053611.1 hypothetical protein [Leptospiraceae bacterium]MBK9500264.1 hypothetical protein [Leptospiraceae bacterium]MBL0263189.1 hypothetical protein [Leptospiraceae bacterium]MBP9161690.1 hypothetical protein [Leptospiraceae bacterium]